MLRKVLNILLIKIFLLRKKKNTPFSPDKNPTLSVDINSKKAPDIF